MTTIIQERMTARTDEEFVVFLIGMRINKPWKIHRWLPVARAMGNMVSELMQQQDSDLLNIESWGGRTTIMIQYWRSFEALENYAKNPQQAHLPAWGQFNKLINSNGDVGIWHETYTIKPGNFEVVYNNMPEFGLAKATTMVSAKGKRKNARGRLTAA
jgi:GH15 family glucan-1,4-alpha-glucosidase